MTAPATEAPRTTDEFPRLDQDLFDWFLSRDQNPGDLLQLGASAGRSAVLIGDFLREGERFTVCGLFESSAPDDAGTEEMRAAFERDYLGCHRELPVIVQGPGSVILDHVAADTCRFAHLDAPHLYQHVRGDIAAARTALKPDGIVVCDDYRSEHTPGVAAAVWEAVRNDDLRPICVSAQKLYGTWGDPAPIRRELLDRLEDGAGQGYEIQQVMGAPLIRIDRPRPTTPKRTMKTALEREQEKHRRTKEALQRKRDHLDDVQRSVSYRVGRLLTAPPRAIRRMPRGPGPSA